MLSSERTKLAHLLLSGLNGWELRKMGYLDSQIDEAFEKCQLLTFIEVNGKKLKRCGRCKVHREHTEFGKNKKWKEGLQSFCKTCKNLSERNRFKINTKFKQKRLEGCKEYRKEHREQIRERGKKYRKRIKESMTEQEKNIQRAKWRRYKRIEKEKKILQTEKK